MKSRSCFPRKKKKEIILQLRHVSYVELEVHDCDGLMVGLVDLRGLFQT